MHPSLKKSIIMLGMAACFAHTPVFADEASDIDYVNKAWAKARFQESEAQQSHDIDALLPKAEALAKHYPNSANALIWAATVYGDKARILGGLSALPYIKTAKAWYEHAIKIDPHGMGGHAQALLGAFYYKVPGWPIAFGDDEKARAYLEAAIKIDPNNPEAHYFYGDFLRLQGDEKGARRELSKAISLPSRPDQLVRDNGRKQEAKMILQEMKEED